MSTTWLLTGSIENWILGIARGSWGLNDSNRNFTYWNRVNKGDIGIFHSIEKSAFSWNSEPMIIGYAVIGDKHKKKTGGGLTKLETKGINGRMYFH